MSLKRRFSEPGFVVSVLVHVGALAATLVAFSHNEKFDDIQETVPVEIVTDAQFNQIMKGDTSAKAVRPEAVAEAEAIAPQPEPQPDPPTPEKTKNEPPPPPPPPPPPLPPVRQVEQPEPPPPAPPTPPVAVLPPPRPQTPEPDATPPVPTPPIRDVEAEPAEPKVEPKPVPKPVPRPVPTPPPVPHPVAAKPPEPHPVPRPRPVPKPKVDLLAKLMDEAPTDATPAPTPHPAPTKAKPTRAPSDTAKFDPNDISKLLSSNAPAQRPSTNHDTSRLASLGSPTASAAKMAPSMWAGLDGLMEDQYRACWSYLGLNAGEKYIPQVRVMYGADGALRGEPVLINPPSDPALQSLADSALRAVRRCNPLKIPEQYAPYYDQWKGRVLRFDPEEMAG